MSAVETWLFGNTAPEKVFNEAVQAIGGALLYAYKPAGRVPGGTVFAIGGGQYGATAIADASITGADDSANYVVAHRTTGAISAATTTTNWNDATTYARIGLAAFTAAVLTYTDWRFLEGGIFGPAPPPAAQAQSYVIACSDFISPIATGAAKFAGYWPSTGTVTEIWAGLATAQSTGSAFTVDVNNGASSMLTTKITFDNGEQTSLTAATPCVIDTGADNVTKGGRFTVDVDQVGDGTARGLELHFLITP